MPEYTPSQLMRSGHVKRWQIVRVAREQTIAEHMYRVWHITRLVCTRLGIRGIERDLAEKWALLHDIPEVVTGDIATPTKIAIRKAVPESDPIRHIELSLDDEYRELYEHIKSSSPISLAIVKMADLIEAIHFLSIEGMGEHAIVVSEILSKSLQDEISSCENICSSVNWGGINTIIEELT